MRARTSVDSVGSTSSSRASPTRCSARSSRAPGRGPRRRRSPRHGGHPDDRDQRRDRDGAIAGTAPARTRPPARDASPTCFARARDEGRAAFIPYVVAGYPDAETSVDDRARRRRRRRRHPRDRAALQRPARRRRDAPARVAGRACAPAPRSTGSLRLIERIGAARPDLPLVPMGYANQVIGGGDGEAVLRRLAGAGAAGVIVADLTPDEGAPFEAVAREVGMAVVYLVAPTTPPERRGRVAARSGGFLYCVSLIGLTGARSALAPEVRELVSRCPLGVAGAGRGRVRDQHAGARRGDRRGRCRWRRRRVGAGRRPGRRWPGHRRRRGARRALRAATAR